MISPLKLLVTAAIIYLVWLLFKYRARIAEIQKEMRAAKARAAGAQSREPAPKAQDLLPCPK
ncbi:MAG: hypothetical protein EXQ84_05785, partial [Rhodospirillaceae bacterium]|nr:hypothetical protein [Rhodospirillaceae bacterium]